jgi:hypothetical protein
LQNKIKSAQTGGKTPQASSTAPNAALEAKIARFMQENKGKSREAVIEYMKKNGHYK